MPTPRGKQTVTRAIAFIGWDQYNDRHTKDFSSLEVLEYIECNQ